jgi:hypothetical protein
MQVLDAKEITAVSGGDAGDCFEVPTQGKVDSFEVFHALNDTYPPKSDSLAMV